MNLHSILNKARRRVARPVAMMAAVGVAMLGGIAFTATSASADPLPQVWVCKYVGTPFVDETLQTGNDVGGLIRVNANATKGATVGNYFADQQGRSYVLDVATDLNTDNGGPGGQKYISSGRSCPAGQGPVTATATFTPGNCDVPGSVVKSSEPAFYHWEETGELGARYYTAVREDGVTLTGQTRFGPFDLRPGQPCTGDVQLPTLTAERVCNAVGSVNAADTNDFTWSYVESNGVRTYTAIPTKAGVVLKGQITQVLDVSPIPSQSTNPNGDCYVALPGEVEGTVVKVPRAAPAVLGVVANAPPAAVAGPGTLAFTGAETVPLGSAGLIMLAVGIVLTAAGRRRSGQRVRG